MARRYRGKRGQYKIMTGLLLLILVAGLVVGLVVFVLPDYLVTAEDGSVRVDIPFLRALWPSPSPVAEQPPAETFPFVEVTPTREVQTESPAPSAPVSVLPKALWVPQEALSEPERLAGLKQTALNSEINMLVLDMKNDEGLMPEAEVLQEAVLALKADGVEVVGRLSCLLDNTVTRQLAAVGVKHMSGVNWLDGEKNRWINLHRPEALAYVVDCIQKAVDAGVDAVLLDNLHFPYEGRLDSIRYGEDADTPAAEALDALFDALPNSLPLYAVALPETLIEGKQEAAGQRFSRFDEVFAKLFVRIPAETAEEAFAEIVAGEGGASLEKIRLVPALRMPQDGGEEGLPVALRALLGVAGGSKGYGYLVVDEQGAYPEGLT